MALLPLHLNPETVHGLFARHYLLMAFLGSLGTLQIAVSIGGYRGLWLIPHRLATRWVGILLIVAGIAIFYLQPMWTDGPWKVGSVGPDSSTREWGRASWGELAGARNVNDVYGGLNGAGQATWFPLATALAFAVSAVSGAIWLRVAPPDRSAPEATVDSGRVDDSEIQQEDTDAADGLEGMRGASFFTVLPRSWRRLRLTWSSDVQREFDPAVNPRSIAGLLNKDRPE